MKVAELFPYGILTEMPIVNYQLHGDFAQPGSFNDAHYFSNSINSKGRSPGLTKDAQIVSTPASIEKLKRIFTKTPFRFAFHMVNYAMTAQFEEARDTAELMMVDTWTPALLEEMFDVTVVIDPSAINVVLFGNTASERDQMSGWMLAHRFTHAIHQHLPGDPAGVLLAMIRNATDRIGHLTGMVNQAELWRLMSNIFTMKSARSQRLEEPELECMCQYLITGRVALNRINPKLTTVIDNLEHQLNTTIEQMMQQCIGKLFVWF